MDEGAPPVASLAEAVPLIQHAGAHNLPGHWDCMVSSVPQDSASKALARRIGAALVQHGKSVWIDVEMAVRDESAREEGPGRLISFVS